MLQETDAGLLSIISYPAFAVDDPELIEKTRETLLEKLKVSKNLVLSVAVLSVTMQL